MSSHQVQSAVGATSAAVGVAAPWWLPLFNEWGQAVLVVGGVAVMALQIWGYVFGFPWHKKRDDEDDPE